MTVNNATVQNILKHANAASDVWGAFLSTLKEKEQAFKEAFHLRPTSKGVTVVSTLPLAPMRGIEVSPADVLPEKLSGIYDRFTEIVADDEKKPWQP